MRVVPIWLVLVMSGVAACGSVANHNPDAGQDGPTGPDPNDGARSGTRLKLKWIDFSGTRVGFGTHDSMLDADCFPGMWSDGNMYCTPASLSAIGYSDAGCTQPVGYSYVDPNCPSPPPDYLIDYRSTICTSTYDRLWERGAAVAGTQYWYKDYLGNCNGPNVDPNIRLYAPGPQVQPSQLAQLTQPAPTAAGRYAQSFYESADGARLLRSAYDTQLDTACSMQRPTEGSVSGTCVPSNSGYAGYFGDAQCTQPKMGLTSGCPLPDYMAAYPLTACPEDSAPTFYALGSQSPNPLYQSDGVSCSSLAPDPNIVYYAAAATLSLPAVSWSRDTVAGQRIQLSHYVEGETRIRDYGIYDTDHDTRCYPMQMSDGMIRCMPLSAGVSTYYTDANCAVPIDLVDIYTGGPTCAMPEVPGLAVKYIPPAPGTCTNDYAAYVVGAAYTGAVYSTNSGTCQLETRNDLLRYRATTSVPANQLATGTVVTDP